MTATNVQEHFEKQVNTYEELMEKLVPYYREQHKIMQSLLPKGDPGELRVLDLGCGNGILSALILEKLPHASLVGFDITAGMLDSYRQKISKLNASFETVLGDYKTDDFGKGWDIIVSGMTLHHLTHAERKAFYHKLYQSMAAGGVYISNDILIDEDLEVRKEQYALWKSFMKMNGEDPDFWYEKHMGKDHPITLSQQFEWLKSAGFGSVGCYWRYINFGITKCIKP